MLEWEDITYSDDENDVGAEAGFTNLETTITINNDDFHTCMFACFLLQEEPKRAHQALKDPSWIEAMQEELLQFKMQKVWVLVDLPNGKRAIGTKWFFRNKKDERGIVVRNKARLVTQGFTQEEGINYEEVFAPVARIEAIRLFLTYDCFMGFMVYQMDVKSAFLYGTIEEEVYVCQTLGFEDPDILTRFTKWSRHYMDDIKLLELDLCKAFEKLMKDKFQMSSMGELTFFLGLQVKQKPNGIFVSHDKYVAEILKIFGLTDGKSPSTPIDTEKPLLKDPDGEDVDVHIYRSMIGSLMYLTSSRPDIMFAVCACARFQVTPKVLHLHAVKRIFRYLKGKPHLSLWYPKDSPFKLVAYSDSDYAGASLDKKSTIGGCQFLGCRLISWQCKKKTVVATSSNEAEYVAAASCCAQVLWIQNQLLNYGLQALVNKKKVIITEATIQEALRLDDAESIDCLPNEEIFTELSRMGYEKPSTKLTFYKAFFSPQWNLVRNVDSSTKFYMYLRFLQLMIRVQVGDLSSHSTKYSSPALTQKVFANMKRVGKGFSRVDTPLFEASTPIDIEKPLLKDPNGEDVDVHIYRSMIGSLMYLNSSRPDIML
nr:hypothetical protein [Tanacetum cinerariifolium]